ncbi:MAG: NAD(+) synthase [Lentisphaerae bacterium]|nr:NAD(+) synthase [Lentisphaerota bacterium]
MKKTTINTRLVQLLVQPGRPHENCDRMIQYADAARKDGIELLIFPEMAVPGYILGDEWEREAFLRECEECTRELVAASTRLVMVFGNVAVDWYRKNEDGRVRKYNALFLAENGMLRGPNSSPYDFVIKTLMPNYREFDDSRHFFGLRQFAIEENKNVNDLISPTTTNLGRIGCMLCEDAWDNDYAIKPLAILASKNCDLLINASSSPFTVDKNSKRNRVFSTSAAQYKCPILYVNNVGIQNNGKTIYTFDGSSCIYDTTGKYVQLKKRFHEDTLTAEVSLSGKTFREAVEQQPDGIAEVFEAVQYGTGQFMRLCGTEKVAIGVSGGIDSAVVAAIYATLLDPSNLLLVNMPSRFNSRTTKDLAQRLAANLGCRYTVIPIEDGVTVTSQQIHNAKVCNTNGGLELVLSLNNPAQENIQARDRSSRILAAVAAAFGGVFTCNSNKSEVTVGYTTFYGDLAGYLANIADLWKTEVYEMAQYINSSVFDKEIIPQGCFTVTPSAELSNMQNVDEGKGDPLIYPYHDALFRSWVERWNRATPEDNLVAYAEGALEKDLGYNGKIADIFPDHESFIHDLERWWNAYQGIGLAKRIQAPPILAVKRRAFGFDHRESQMGARYTRRYYELKRKLLG